MNLHLFLALLMMMAGCDRSPASSTSTQPQLTAATAPAAGDGVITGFVSVVSHAPVLPRIDVSGVADCQKLHPDGLPDESIVVDSSGKLANCLVYLRGLPPSPPDPSLPPVTLDQKGCRYLPHVVALRTGQALDIRSSDPFLHNVHVMAEANPAVNFSQIAANSGDADRTLHFASAEIMRVKCDVHPWMRAWIAVMDQPCFAVSATDGSFRIEHVPPGQHTLVCWQERLGELTQQVTVGEHQQLKQDFQFSP